MKKDRRQARASPRSAAHHGDVVVLSDDASDPLQLLLQVVGPNLTYLVVHSSSGHSATSWEEMDARRRGGGEENKQTEEDSWFIDLGQPADQWQTT